MVSCIYIYIYFFFSILELRNILKFLNNDSLCCVILSFRFRYMRKKILKKARIFEVQMSGYFAKLFYISPRQANGNLISLIYSWKLQFPIDLVSLRVFEYRMAELFTISQQNGSLSNIFLKPVAQFEYFLPIHCKNIVELNYWVKHLKFSSMRIDLL